ncbi:DNA-binding transcriptional ArsR family regulator [Ochrobactrum anthropi]|uniref:ArsR/SmtB family transcription factor n=1 Tax=Brucella anthropi TaxID=529 RepID=UPI0015FB91C7|nr:metalloregulator ArsR/SmtB family transcription factor [Brucella anthropi]MBA8862853.1 DNA-binding transcriptional ArsR family regulator [Brucella anthropi]
MNHTQDTSQKDDLTGILNALANQNRLSIIAHLINGEVTVSALADAVGLSQPALSQHLIKLRDAGIVVARKNSQKRYYSLTAAFIGSTLGKCLFQELNT